MKATENRRIRYPGKIWTTSLAITVEKKFIMMGTTIAQLNTGSKKMQRISEKLSRGNPPTNPLVEDARNHWQMSKTLCAVS